MVAVIPEVLTRVEAVRERDELLRRIPDRESFFQRAETFDLTSTEQSMYDRLSDLDYLLGDE